MENNITLWFKVDGYRRAVTVDVAKGANVLELMEAMIQKHPRMFGGDLEAGLWDLYKSDQLNLPLDSWTLVAELQDAGKAGPTALLMKRAAETLPQIPFPPRTGVSYEGLPDASQNPVIYRTDLVKKISDKMEDLMSLLITSPSFTGKTSLANLMYNHWQKSGKIVHFISFAALRTAEDLYEYVNRYFGFQVGKVFSSDGYLIMDETQNIYRYSEFWTNLKSGVQKCRVLVFGVYGLSTVGNDRSPSQFVQKWYYDDVKFTNQECLELAESFKKYQPSAKEILIPDILGNLFQFVNNHPGLVYLALHTLCYEFTHTPYHARGIADIQKLISKGSLLFELLKARCFVLDYEKVTQMLGAKTKQTMHDLITNDFIPFKVDLLDVHRSGICIADKGESTLKFSSEIMRVFYRNMYYKATYGVNGSNVITNWTNETVFTLLKRILELFNPQVFLSTQDRGRNGLIYERIYQDEFYRCCYLLAPSKFSP